MKSGADVSEMVAGVKMDRKVTLIEFAQLRGFPKIVALLKAYGGK